MQFIMTYKPNSLPLPNEITEKLNLKKGDIIMITIEKVYLDKNIKKQIGNKVILIP